MRQIKLNGYIYTFYDSNFVSKKPIDNPLFTSVLVRDNNQFRWLCGNQTYPLQDYEKNLIASILHIDIE